MNFTKLPVIEGNAGGCACCPPARTQLCAATRIAVGFGYAALTKDGDVIWQEQGQDWEDCMTVAQAEELAAADPDHDWRIELYGPLRGRLYQRQGDGQWMLVQQNEGFA